MAKPKTESRREGPGRPARTGEAANLRICVAVTQEERDRWNAAAAELGTTTSELAREAWESAVVRAELMRKRAAGTAQRDDNDADDET